MSLAAAIAAEAAESVPGSRCGVAVLFELIPDADRKVLVEALGGPTPGSAIARALRKEYPGLTTPSGLTVQRHRKRECRCP